MAPALLWFTERVTMLVLATAMLLAGWAGHARARPGAVLLVLLSVAWLVLSVRPEGLILWTVTPDHGLVAADLWGLAGLVVGVALLVRGPAVRQRRDGHERESSGLR